MSFRYYKPDEHWQKTSRKRLERKTVFFGFSDYGCGCGIIRKSLIHRRLHSVRRNSYRIVAVAQMMAIRAGAMIVMRGRWDLFPLRRHVIYRVNLLLLVTFLYVFQLNARGFGHSVQIQIVILTFPDSRPTIMGDFGILVHVDVVLSLQLLQESGDRAERGRFGASESVQDDQWSSCNSLHTKKV